MTFTCVLRDIAGRRRLRLEVGFDEAPPIELLDEGGVVTARLPETATWFVTYAVGHEQPTWGGERPLTM